MHAEHAVNAHYGCTKAMDLIRKAVANAQADFTIEILDASGEAVKVRSTQGLHIL